MRAKFHGPLVERSVEVAEARSSAVDGGLVGGAFLGAVYRSAGGVLGGRAPRAQRADPARAAILSFARVGCQLARFNVLLDRCGRDVGPPFFSPVMLGQGARQAGSASSGAVALLRIKAPWVLEIRRGPVLAELQRASSAALRRGTRTRSGPVICGARRCHQRLFEAAKSRESFCAQ